MYEPQAPDRGRATQHSRRRRVETDCMRDGVQSLASNLRHTASRDDKRDVKDAVVSFANWKARRPKLVAIPTVTSRSTSPLLVGTFQMSHST